MKFYCFCSASLLLLIQLSTYLSTDAYTIDPCGSLKCTEPEISCLLLIPETRSYECKCRKTCKSPSLIRAPFVRTLSPKSTRNPKNMRQVSGFNESVTPAVKQYGNNVVTLAPGGSSCYPSACMNGGTCYSTPYPTTTTTTRAYTTIPVCSCQPQFTGSRCELYTPTVPPSDGWNNLCRVYNERNMNICQNGGQCVFISDGKVACVCPSTYTGQFCELPVYIQCTGAYRAQCHRDYGTCAADGSCQCMNGYCGPKCDMKNQNNVPATNPPSPYNPATNPPSPYNPITNPPSPYNPVTYPPSPYNPVTNPPYNPVTNPPYNPVTNPPYNPVTYPPYNPITNPPSPYNPYNPVTNPPYNPVTNPPYNPITNPPSPYNPYNPATNPPYNPYPTGSSFVPISTPQPSNGCPFGYCMNGGTCVQLGGNVYMGSSYLCICSVYYTGSRCEQPMSGGVTPPSTTVPGGTTTTTTTTKVTSTIQPHCNFTFTLLNDGAYSARYIVEYYIDGVKQQNIVSNTLPFIGQYTSVTIPYYATGVSVTLQNLGFQWNDIAKDTNIDTLKFCTKCYKTWNTVTDPKWDYIPC